MWPDDEMDKYGNVYTDPPTETMFKDFIKRIQGKAYEETDTRRRQLIQGLRELDISDQLPEDVRAKLIMLNGDFLVIPVEKIT